MAARKKPIKYSEKDVFTATISGRRCLFLIKECKPGPSVPDGWTPANFARRQGYQWIPKPRRTTASRLYGKIYDHQHQGGSSK